MGINVNGLRFLLRARQKGADFSRVAMLGRQGIHMDVSAFRRVICSEFGITASPEILDQIHAQFFADDLFRFLGAQVVDSFDVSTYEGANCAHDFNFPISDLYKEKYSLVFDGGMLEHIFFFPTALRNAMELLAVEGTFLGVSAANNEMGHGFYQLSPELYYRALSPANGFRVEELFLHEGRESRRWFMARDPDEISQRVMLNNTKPTLLLVQAKRVCVAPIFESAPQQSDYARAWDDEGNSPQSRNMHSGRLKPISKLIPYRVKWIVTVGRGWLRGRVQRFLILIGGGHDQRALVAFDPVAQARVKTPDNITGARVDDQA